MRTIYMILLVLLPAMAAGCGGSQPRSDWPTIARQTSQKRAAFELNCPFEQVVVTDLSTQRVMGSYFFTHGVEGCGQREIYRTACMHGACTASNEKYQQPGYSGSSPSSTQPGVIPGAPPGSPPGTLPGTPPGSVPGTIPGAPPGSPPGTLPGTPPGSVPGTIPGAPPGSPPGTMPGAAPGSFGGFH